MSRCFITGVAGFLGSHLAYYLMAQGHTVFGIDDFSTGDPDNFKCEPDDWGGDIAALEPQHFEDIDVVYHLAAAAYEGVSNFSPSYISRNIYAGSANVFSAAIAAGVKRIVFTSSMARYGQPIQIHNESGLAVQPISLTGVLLPMDALEPDTGVWHSSLFTEDQKPKPVDPYGIAKEAAERLLINLCETHGVEWSIAVPHNIYGPRQAIDPYRNVATIFANQMLLGKRPIIYGDGTQKRCFSYVDDVVPSLARMGFDSAAVGQIINLGPDEGEVTILKLAEILADIIDVKFDPMFLPSRPREVKIALCSSKKARDLLEFEPHTALRDGLVKLVEWLRIKGPREFRYHLPIEIESPLVPVTWINRTM